MGQHCIARCRLSASSIVVCSKARGRSAAAGPGVWPCVLFIELLSELRIRVANPGHTFWWRNGLLIQHLDPVYMCSTTCAHELINWQSDWCWSVPRREWRRRERRYGRTRGRRPNRKRRNGTTSGGQRRRKWYTNHPTPTTATTQTYAASAVATEKATSSPVATAYVTMGVAPVDGDLLPPRFNGDRKTDAEEWLQDLFDYMEMRSTAAVLLCNRLTGASGWKAWSSNLEHQKNMGGEGSEGEGWRGGKSEIWKTKAKGT